MTRPDPQPPPGRTLHGLTGTPLLRGTTGANPAGSAGQPEPAGTSGAAGASEPVAPLLPAWARRPAAIAVACCAVLVGVLGGFAANRSHGNAVDRPVDAWLRHHLSSHLHALSDISYLGGSQLGIVLTAALVLACLVARRVNGALLAFVSVVVAIGVTELVLKPLVHETIKGSLTYPSGHTASLFTLTAVIGVLLLNPPHWRPGRSVRIVLMAGLVAISCVVAVATIALNYHYFTDTIAGAALGTGVTLATAFPLDRPGVRRQLAAIAPRWLTPRSPA